MPGFKTFRQWSKELAPPWLSREWGTRLTQAWGLFVDLQAEGTNQARKAGLMDSNTFPPDALKYIGLERNIERYPSDTDATYKARLQRAFDAWKAAGSKLEMIQQFAAMGLTITVYEDFDWDWDGHTSTSRFWIVITAHPWAAAWLWGATEKWGAHRTWGSTATSADVSRIRRVARKWKAGHTAIGNIILVTNPGTWSPTPAGNWDDPANRSAGAVYWDG